jgi:hypothetical protein
MKKLRCTKFYVVFFILPLITNNVYSQWSKAWSNSWVSSISYINGIALMSTGNGIMKSTDKGVSWFSSSSGLPNNVATAFGYAEGIYYIGISNDGLYKSTDEGANWTSCNLPGFICDIKSHNNSIYIGFNDFSSVANACHGIYVSNDKGINFTNITNNANFGQIGHVWTMDFNNDYLFNASEGGIYRTNDNGQTWEPLYECDELNGEYIDSRSMVTINNTVIWSTSSRVFYSTNNGDNWFKSFDNATLQIIKSNNILFLRGSDLVYSTDEGRTWDNFSDDFTDLELTWENYCICVIDDKVCIGTSTGLYYKTFPLLSVANENKQNSIQVNFDRINDNLSFSNGIIVNSISIYNISGEFVFNSNSNCNNVDVNNLNSGVYFIEFQYNGNSYKQKLNIIR